MFKISKMKRYLPYTRHSLEIFILTIICVLKNNKLMFDFLKFDKNDPLFHIDTWFDPPLGII